MWHDFFAAIGMMLVLEGIMPFLNPDRLRQTLFRVAQLDDRTLRFAGVSSMLVGLVVLYLIRFYGS